MNQFADLGCVYIFFLLPKKKKGDKKMRRIKGIFQCKGTS